MKVLKQLIVDGKIAEIVTESVALDFTAPGKAIFVVRDAAAAIGSMVTFGIGIDGEIHEYFTGIAVNVIVIDSHQTRIFARELDVRLEDPCCLAMRNTTPKKILAAIASEVKIDFLLHPSCDAWKDLPVYHFAAMDDGFFAVESLIRHLNSFNILTNSNAAGQLIIGSEEEIHGKTLIISDKFFTGITVAGADCAVLPALRPGRKLQIGDGLPQVITSITVNNEKMRVNF